MKEIVVAIDFSKGSIHALEYAIELANLAQSNITMVWVDDQGTKEIPMVSESSEIREDAKKNLEELVRTYKDTVKPGKLSYKIRKGKVYLELCAQAKTCDCSILITGTHGITGFEEYWIGSNASHIISYSPCPVITVKTSYDINRGYRRILVPVSQPSQTIQKAPMVAKFAQISGADINILGLYTSKLKTMQRVVDNHIAKLEKYFKDQKVNFEVETVVTDNLTATVLEHVQSTDADMIAVVSDFQNNPAETIFGQYAQQLVNFSPVPVLSVHSRDTFTL